MSSAPPNRWDEPTLGHLAIVDDLYLAVHEPDGTSRRPIPVWVVTTGREAYLRSYRGSEARWYQRALASGKGSITVAGRQLPVTLTPSTDREREADVDAAYLSKYARYSYVFSIVTPGAVAATLLLRPAEAD